ncbi:thioredoxin (plasmid) [Natrialba magadii ATCC 43099]|uniref:Redoxin domain-containing protein n=1 Tax=Natrialba magadii (strain ATCC 43099 / DSM 3394 / CCM 3739 / CIP 104546 / IAM 13178 / JCM 8861 / NBRC 102185 / NCIMB 2190 / MS3) TaxID=547559 RepID=D3T0Z2_NATMM|nr:TlpA family protein disulfide reductase [Natrialba magadii]ADD07251.1 thioredoxin [Natrialba magadii ATCC 43099]ELY34361.1 Redoxin domain-containing protein [Natrialba magadii ATCC 43099]
MRRRDVIAGVASLGVVGGGGLVAVRGLPSVDSDGATHSEGSDAEPADPITIETVAAPGSEAGEATIPADDRVTFVDFFGTWCPPCIEQMPALADTHDRIGEDVLFLSVTNEAVGSSITEAELVAWWDNHDGDWLLGLDPAAELTARYFAGGYPSAVTIDTDGHAQWSDSGVKTADELAAGIERALETERDA